MAVFDKKGRPPKLELYPASEEEKNTINLIAGDLAEVNGTSKSQVILDGFLKANTPTTDNGKFILNALVWDGGSVKDTLSVLCSNMASGSNWEPAYSNGYELLEFINSKFLENYIKVDWSNGACNHMLNCFESIVTAMNGAYEAARDEASPDWFTISREARFAAGLYDEFCSGKKDGYAEPASNLTSFIKANWSVLERNQMVWRCLTTLCDATMGWPDYADHDGQRIHVRSPRAAELRLQTIDLIERITKGWEAEKAEKAES